MADMPKLTPTFADQVAANNLAGQYDNAREFMNQSLVGPQTLTTFPASRTVTWGPSPEGGPPLPVSIPQREKVAIVGTAPSSRMLAPFHDMSWDIWVCSPGNMNVIPRVDAWFEIHANLLWPEYADAYGKNYIKWLSEQPFPVYLQDEKWHPKYFANGLKFPADELIAKFGGNFFTSSFAWMTAFALHKGYKEIGLFGVDMASKDEYIQQRQAFYYWLEKAESLGVKITIPPESDLKQPPGLYGFSDVTRYGRKKHARKQELLGRIALLEKQEIPNKTAELRALQDNCLYLKGALEDIDYDLSIWIRVGHELGEQNG